MMRSQSVRSHAESSDRKRTRRRSSPWFKQFAAALIGSCALTSSGWSQSPEGSVVALPSVTSVGSCRTVLALGGVEPLRTNVDSSPVVAAPMAGQTVADTRSTTILTTTTVDPQNPQSPPNVEPPRPRAESRPSGIVPPPGPGPGPRPPAPGRGDDEARRSRPR